MIVSAVTFDELGLRISVSRGHNIACVSFWAGTDPPDLFGALIRTKSGYLNWLPCQGKRLPIEVFACASTMI